MSSANPSSAIGVERYDPVDQATESLRQFDLANASTSDPSTRLDTTPLHTTSLRWPQSTLRLPLDVIGIIAEALAEDRQLKTLASLNITAHLVHEQTLPPLYHTFQVPLRDKFTSHIVEFRLPGGWAYTKYLCIYESSFNTLHTLEYCFHMHHQRAPREFDIANLFPRLVAMRLLPVPAPINYRRRQYELEDPCYEKYVCVYHVLDDLVKLSFRKGAYLVASTIQNCTHFEQNWARQRLGTVPEDPLQLIIKDKVANQNIDATIQLVFEIMTFVTRPDCRRPFLGFSLKRGLTVTCYRSVFESFARLYAEYVEHIPSLFAMQIYLEERNMINRTDMQRYMRSLADTYERHWLHVDRDGIRSTPTVRVYAGICLPARYQTIHERRFGVLQGILEVGQSPDRQDDHFGQAHEEEGFHCQLFEGYGSKDDGEDGEGQEEELIWEDGDFLEPAWSYPCSNAPLAEFWYNHSHTIVYEEF